MKGQLPLSVGSLGSQGVEQFSRSEALVFRPDSSLFLFEHVHEFNPNEGAAGGVEGLEPQHRSRDPLHGAVVLLVVF